MKALTEAQADQLATYRREADELRKKIAATEVRDERAILPVNGIVRVPNNYAPLSAGQALAVFGESVFSDALLQEIADDGRSPSQSTGTMGGQSPAEDARQDSMPRTPAACRCDC